MPVHQERGNVSKGTKYATQIFNIFACVRVFTGAGDRKPDGFWKTSGHDGLETRPSTTSPTTHMEKPENTRESLGFLLLWLGQMAFMAVGILLLFLGSRNLLRGHASNHWPKADGIIQSSSISRFDSSGSGPQHTTYGGSVAYDFQVAGSNYSGSRVTFADYAHDMNHAQAVRNRYPEGKRVTVHYAPDNPQLAVLETGITDGMWILPTGGVIFSAVGIMIFAIRRQVRQMAG